MLITEYDKMKIKPYEACPCDSGNKFKFCCYQKAREDLRKEEKLNSYSKDRLNHMNNMSWKEANFDICLGFNKDECKGEIKNAHTIQNNGILNKIQEEGHVYHIVGEFDENLEYKSTFKKISRNKASTFMGFCDYHDTKLFEKIEKEQYENENKQNFLFAFRSLTLQLHDKLRRLKHFRSNFKKYPAGMLDAGLVSNYRVNQLDIDDYEEEYNLFKDDYINKEFDNLRTIYSKLDNEVHFTTSAGFAVQHDLKGNLINDIIFDKSSKKMPSIYLNIYPVNGGTNIILSYRTNDCIYEDYFDQLEAIPPHILSKHLNYLVIQYTENVFFKPSLIEKMNDQERDSLLRSFSSSMNLGDKIELLEEDNYFKFNIFKQTP